MTEYIFARSLIGKSSYFMKRKFTTFDKILNSEFTRKQNDLHYTFNDIANANYLYKSVRKAQTSNQLRRHSKANEKNLHW